MPANQPASKHRPILFNSDSGNAFAEFWRAAAPMGTIDANAVTAVVENSIDEMARAGIDSLAVVVSHRFESVLGPSRVLGSEWPLADKDGGYAALRAAGVDVRQLMARHCHRRGLEFLGCMRMNDRHGAPLPVGRFIQDNPQWHLTQLSGGPAIDFAPDPVRQILLHYIEELVDAVEVDGIVFDYMRWCHLFPPGQGAENAHLLTDFTRKTRALLDAAGAARGEGRLKLGVRVPQTLAECDYLGFDIPAWIGRELVDFVVPSDFFFTDLNTRVEEFVALCAGTDCQIYPAIHPPVCHGDDVGINDLSHYRAAAHNFYAGGAAGVEVYNYQYHWGRRIGRNTPWEAHQWPAALDYLRRLRSAADIARHDRHYRFYPLWQNRSPTGGEPKDDRIHLDRAAPRTSGSQSFRLAEDPGAQNLRATLQFKALALGPGDALEIQLNGSAIAAAQITRHDCAAGQNEWQGRVLPAYWLYIVDLDWKRQTPPLVKGDNELRVTLLAARAEREAGTVCIDELEVYIYVRQKLDENQFAQGR